MNNKYLGLNTSQISNYSIKFLYEIKFIRKKITPT